ncbi:MAG: hypothetical protein JSV46_02870 [Candidatus Aminicenantes bacterium]|nr:MAG: hypothetical protein JSV46_02870 [Candidatus Aminicenantes bacterium]
MTEQKEQTQSKQDAQKKVLDKRLDALGWGLFLIMIGCLWLIPEESVPEGTWLIGAGVIILGLIGIRFLYGIKISGVWLVIGVLALAFGISDFSGLNLPVLPILIILFGLSIILKPLLKKK